MLGKDFRGPRLTTAQIVFLACVGVSIVLSVLIFAGKLDKIYFLICTLLLSGGTFFLNYTNLKEDEARAKERRNQMRERHRNRKL